MTKEALKLALKALENIKNDPFKFDLKDDINKAIKVLRLVIDAENISSKPVAWEQFYPDMGKPQLTLPQRTWVGLTDEEIEKMGLSNYIKVVRETEDKIKEKNG